MIYSYCKRCNLESPGDTCTGCGKRAAVSAQMDQWSIAINPLMDGRVWRAALIALCSERILSFILDRAVEQSTLLYAVLLYFVVVAVSEESAKYFMLRLRTWRSEEFNCQYDGVVYAVFVSLGFALWENISYVMHYGFQTALVRAVTAIPGHACFGVFMGVFYGAAKRLDNEGKRTASRVCRRVGLLLSILLHGAYDFIASTESDSGSWYFVGFVAVMFIVSYLLVGRAAKKDKYIA